LNDKAFPLSVRLIKPPPRIFFVTVLGLPPFLRKAVRPTSWVPSLVVPSFFVRAPFRKPRPFHVIKGFFSPKNNGVRWASRTSFLNSAKRRSGRSSAFPLSPFFSVGDAKADNSLPRLDLLFRLERSPPPPSTVGITGLFSSLHDISLFPPFFPLCFVDLFFNR